MVATPVGHSKQEYARHRGCSRQAVDKAIATGRLRSSLVPGTTRIRDFEEADQEWAANTDFSRRLLYEVRREAASDVPENAVIAIKGMVVVTWGVWPLDPDKWRVLDMNPAGARDLARRLVLEADEIDGAADPLRYSSPGIE